MKIEDLKKVSIYSKYEIKRHANGLYPAGKLLKELRIDKGITQNQMAEKLETSQSVISRKESEQSLDLDFANDYLYQLELWPETFSEVKRIIEAMELPNFKAFKQLSMDDFWSKMKILESTENEKTRLLTEINDRLKDGDVIKLSQVLRYIKMYEAYEESNECSIE